MAMAYQPARGGDQSSSASSNVASSFGSSVAMDEAFRRVGHRLSQRVGGDSCNSTVVSVQSLGEHPASAFHSGQDEHETVRTNAQLDYDRTSKVAKTQYTDHGTHEKLVTGSILKNLTLRAKDTYATLSQQQTQNGTPPKAGTKRVSPTCSISPHRHALGALQLDDDKEGPKGLLQAALDVSSNSSSASTAPVSHFSKGKCLTQPSEPVSNHGLDNADGNLIVHENDVINVVSAQVHALSQNRSQFRVLSLLGQGTFAQVFKCRCLKTGDIVALKVVKNKPAYTRQAAVEIDVFNALSSNDNENMVRLECYFLYRHHLCLVFELLGLNLYEVLKRRQFRGLPLTVVRSLLQQAMEGVKDLSQRNIVHCDLKPENILLVDENADVVVNAGERRKSIDLTKEENSKENAAMSSFGGTPTTDDTGRTSSEASSQVMEPGQKIKLIDFGSACFEGHVAHTYIQSRFYRCPEILVGVPYDSAIDMWSLGCVAAELFLGLPILPGVNEHDQLGRITEMIGPLPDRMLEQGSKSAKYYVKELSRSTTEKASSDLPPRTPSPGMSSGTPPPPRATWRIKTHQEYVQSLSPNEVRKKGGMAKLQKQPTNRYFKRKKLADIIMLHGHSTSKEEKEMLGLFAHFLMGILDPDPLKRWTAYQASTHPFLTGSAARRRRSDPSQVGKASPEFDILWAPPWDAAICRRKLLDVQRTREKQQALRRSLSAGNQPRTMPHVSPPDRFPPLHRGEPTSPSLNRPSRVPPGIQASRQGAPQPQSRNQVDQISPPNSIGAASLPSNGRAHNQVYAGLPQHRLPGSLGSGGMNMNDGVHMMGSLPHWAYVAPSSLTDFNSGVATDRRSSLPSMMVPASAQVAYAEAQMTQSMMGPQSYSGIYDDHVTRLSFEGDFAYALHRPGVVPGMDLSSSATMYPQVSGHPPYSTHQQLPPNHQRSRSFTHSAGDGSPWRQRSRSSYMPGGIPSSPGNPGQYMHNSFMGPTSIQEDSSDFNLGGSLDTTSQPTRSDAGSSAASLLTQQLEIRSGGHQAPPPMADSYQEMMYDGNLAPSSLPPSYVAAPGPMYVQAAGQAAGMDSGAYYYTTYLSADGVVMSAPVNVDPRAMQHMQQSYGSYGSYPDQPPMHVPYGAPPASLPQVYPPSQVAQNLNGEVQRPQRPPPNFHRQGMSM